MKNYDFIRVGDKVWCRYNTKEGQLQNGDYAYLNAYAKEREELIAENDISYVKMFIEEIFINHGIVTFVCQVLSSDEKQLYKITISDNARFVKL